MCPTTKEHIETKHKGFSGTAIFVEPVKQKRLQGSWLVWLTWATAPSDVCCGVSARCYVAEVSLQTSNCQY